MEGSPPTPLIPELPALTEEVPPLPPPADWEPPPPPPPPRRRWPALLAVVLALCAIGGAGAVPVPCEVQATVRVHPLEAPVDVTLDRPGKVAKLTAEAGAFIEPGQALLLLDDAPLKEKLLALDRELATLDKQLRRSKKKARSSRARRAKSALFRAEREVKRTRGSVRVLEARLARRATTRLRRDLAKTKRRLREKEAEAARAKAIYEAASATTELEALDQRKAEAKKRREAVAQELTRLLVKAEAAGRFQPLVKAGDALEEGAIVGRLQDLRRLQGRLSIPAEDAHRIARGDLVALALRGEAPAEIAAVLASVGEEAHGIVTAEVTFDNPEGALPPTSEGTALIQCRARPLFRVLFPQE